MINYFTDPAVASRTSDLRQSSDAHVNRSPHAKMPFHFQAKPAGFGQKVFFCLRGHKLYRLPIVFLLLSHDCRGGMADSRVRSSVQNVSMLAKIIMPGPAAMC